MNYSIEFDYLLKGVENMQNEFSPTQKAAILKEHFIQHVPIREVLEKHNITRSTFDGWIRNVFNYSELVLKKIPSDAMSYTTNYDVITTWFATVYSKRRRLMS